MRLAICILTALACTGCFALDELEKGQAIMDAHSPKSEDHAGPAEAGSPEGADKSARERLAEYYAKQRAKAETPKKSDDPGDAIGECRIGSSSKFLRRSDCQLRGGTFH